MKTMILILTLVFSLGASATKMGMHDDKDYSGEGCPFCDEKKVNTGRDFNPKLDKLKPKKKAKAKDKGKKNT